MEKRMGKRWWEILDVINGWMYMMVVVEHAHEKVNKVQFKILILIIDQKVLRCCAILCPNYIESAKEWEIKSQIPIYKFYTRLNFDYEQLQNMHLKIRRDETERKRDREWEHEMWTKWANVREIEGGKTTTDTHTHTRFEYFPKILDVIYFWLSLAPA